MASKEKYELSIKCEENKVTLKEMTSSLKNSNEATEQLETQLDELKEENGRLAEDAG